MLDGLTTDVILGMDFLKWYNPTVGWILELVCLVWRKMVVAVNQVQSIGDAVGSLHGNMNTFSNGVRYCDQVVVSVRQVGESIKVNVVSASAFVNMVCGDSDAVTWCTLVCPMVN